MKDIVIIYHGDCLDGFGGAWAAYKKFGDSADYIPGYYDNTFFEGLENKEIYFIDFMYSAEVTKELVSKNRKVTAIDHHLSTSERVKLTNSYSYSIENSGSVLAWKYFHQDIPTPKMLEYIEDRDLWRFKFKETLAACYFIDSFDFNFDVWDKLVKDFDSKEEVREHMSKGEAIVKYNQRMINRVIKEGAKLVSFEGFEAYAVNANQLFVSQIGAVLYERKPPIAIIWSEDKNFVKVSLRSNGTVDVSKIAEKFGGGGHWASAGFRLLAIGSFPWKEKNV